MPTFNPRIGQTPAEIERRLAEALAAMIDIYGDPEGFAPIPVLEQAKDALQKAGYTWRIVSRPWCFLLVAPSTDKKWESIR